MDKRNITITPWKPTQGESVLLHLPRLYTEDEISELARMFIVGDTQEVRWQYGHSQPKGLESFSGNGHYARAQ